MPRFKVRNRFAFHILNKKDRFTVKDIVPAGGVVVLDNINQYEQSWKLQPLTEEEELKMDAAEKKAAKEKANPRTSAKTDKVDRKSEILKEKEANKEKAKALLNGVDSPDKPADTEPSEEPKVEVEPEVKPKGKGKGKKSAKAEEGDK